MIGHAAELVLIGMRYHRERHPGWRVVSLGVVLNLVIIRVAGIIFPALAGDLEAYFCGPGKGHLLKRLPCGIGKLDVNHQQPHPFFACHWIHIRFARDDGNLARYRDRIRGHVKRGIIYPNDKTLSLTGNEFLGHGRIFNGAGLRAGIRTSQADQNHKNKHAHREDGDEDAGKFRYARFVGNLVMVCGRGHGELLKTILDSQEFIPKLTNPSLSRLE